MVSMVTSSMSHIRSWESPLSEKSLVFLEVERVPVLSYKGMLESIQRDFLMMLRCHGFLIVIDPDCFPNDIKLILKFGEPKKLMELKVHQHGCTNSKPPCVHMCICLVTLEFKLKRVEACYTNTCLFAPTSHRTWNIW